MSKRKAVQDMLKISNGLFLGVLKRDNITEDLMNKGFIESVEEIEQWKEELIVELYNEIIDEPYKESIVMKIKLNCSIEEQIGALEHLLSTGIDSSIFKNQRILLIRKLYNDLDHVKEFNDIINGINGLETEGEKQ